jgi:diadenosine tetraphosphatase ApaH/serine/threonine PP2A family protein phosphatase
MRILVISDIHANLTALEAVLQDAGEIDATWCLGDLVGYGPDPNECINRIRQLPNSTCLIGNHDAAALEKIDIRSFNPEARLAILWTQEWLEPANKDYLSSLPDHQVIGDVTIAHGSPRQPVWEYLLDTRTATQNFDFFTTPFCFVGHSHLPVIYQLTDGHRMADMFIPEPQIETKLVPRAILNPGSVGQPRDRDPRAAYAIFDTDSLTWEPHRVEYDISSVQARMQTAELPQRHIARLTSGW